MEFLVLLGLIVIVLAIFSAVFSAIAKPKGRDLAFLTSSAPGEQVLDYRVCNACLKDAEPNALVKLAFILGDADDAADATFSFIKAMTGGLWVGGRVFLTTHRVVFMPNMLNRAVHESLSTICVRLPDVTRVKYRFGIFTKIVDVKTASGTLTVRGYKMKQFADAIDRAIKLPRRIV